ncbi:MAG: histidinol-phosphate transaminase [Bacteroidia bacterium]
MSSIQSLVRPNIVNLKAYSSARDEFSGQAGVFLDANENPFGTLNRYPDPHQVLLKKQLAALKQVAAKNIFIGNGSDEVIDVLYRVFCTPEKDQVILCPPTYGMYEVSAQINGVGIINIPLDAEFQLQTEKVLAANKHDQTAKLLFLCSPNNPTGNSLLAIDELLKSFQGIVVVDEAYIDFSRTHSYLEKLQAYPNLVIMQTFSKARGLAAARVGVAYASEEIIQYMNKVKPPYNVSKLNQEAALEALAQETQFQQKVNQILEQRAWLEQELKQLDLVRKIYPSDANFLLIEVNDANRIYANLVSRNVITRNRHNLVENCIRITVGHEAENQKLIDELKKIKP